jgi:hypothetical protein
MKLKVRSDDASTLREHDWPQMGDWLAQLRDDSRDDSRGEPPGDGHAGAEGADHPSSEALAQPDVRAEAHARAQADACAQADARAKADAHAEAEAGATGQAVIGDQLRVPIMWCEIGSCIAWYSDPAALGEADTRARAIGAGWRIDALGRLACPRCQQTDPRFWASRPVVPWDRYMAIARTTRAAVSGGGTADSAAGGTSHDPSRAASGYPPASPAEREWHHYLPPAQAMSARRYAENPAGTLIRAAWPWNSAPARQACGGRQAATSLNQ